MIKFALRGGKVSDLQVRKYLRDYLFARKLGLSPLEVSLLPSDEVEAFELILREELRKERLNGFKN